MTTPLKYSVGLDCSKDEFSAAIALIDSFQKVTIKSSRKFKNSIKGFNECEYWILQHQKEKVPIVLTMEATGNYYENLAFYFYQKDFYVSVLLPNKSKKYIQSRGIKTKNDPVDAKGLAQMGAEQNLKRWQPFSKNIYQLRLLTRHCEQLTIHRTQLMNQLLSLNAGMYQNKPINQHIKKLISLIESQIKDTKIQIEVIIKNDLEILKKFNKIISIKGVGILTVAVIIAETNGFELFQNQRQLSSYAGYDIVENSSGKRIGKTRISKKGNSHIRRAMHMPALNIVRYQNPVFVSLYNRILQRTNKKMKAYVAVQRKLLCLIYTLWKKDEIYNPNILKTSGNDEPKQLFPLGFEEAVKQVVPIQKHQDYTR